MSLLGDGLLAYTMYSANSTGQGRRHTNLHVEWISEDSEKSQTEGVYKMVMVLCLSIRVNRSNGEVLHMEFSVLLLIPNIVSTKL